MTDLVSNVKWLQNPFSCLRPPGRRLKIAKASEADAYLPIQPCAMPIFSGPHRPEGATKGRGDDASDALSTRSRPGIKATTSSGKEWSRFFLIVWGQ